MNIFRKRRSEIDGLKKEICCLQEIQKLNQCEKLKISQKFLSLEHEIDKLKQFKTDTENNIRLKQFKKLIGKDVINRSRGHMSRDYIRRGKLLSVKIIENKFQIVIENFLGIQVLNFNTEDLINLEKYKK
jgi:hypothetical protein